MALPPTGRISTRTRRRTVSAAGAAPPAVDYGFESGGVPRTSSSRVDPPPRVSHPRLPLAAAPSTSRAPTPVPTVPIPSDRNRAEPLGLPLLGLSTPSESPPPLRPIGTPSTLLPNYTFVVPLGVIRTPTGRESNVQSLRAAIQNILFGRPLALPTEVLARFPSHQRSPFLEIQELAGKGRLHATDEDIVLLVRNPTPAHYSLRPAGRAACLLCDESTRVYVPLLVRP